MKFSSKKNDRGFTLVEVLVAVVILSVGLLAVAGMQLNSMRGSNNALYRSQAVLGAEDVMDRMRANAAAARDGDYNIAVGVVPVAPTYTGVVLADLVGWKVSLAANLPQGEGSVVVTDILSPGPLPVVIGHNVRVVVRWADSFGQDTIVMESRL